MNRIYKVIWSKVKHQYVVTSEFAHSCTKSTTSRVGKGALAALVAFVLTAGVGGVQAAEPITGPVEVTGDVTIKGDDGQPIVTVTDDGGNKLINANGTGLRVGWISSGAAIQGMVLRTNNEAFTADSEGNVKANSLSLRTDAGELNVGTTLSEQQAILDDLNAAGIVAGTASDRAIAIGEGSHAYMDSTAIGLYAAARSNESVAIGEHAVASQDKSVAIGMYAKTSAEKTTAIGRHAIATAENSIALGAYSETGDRVNTVSVGKAGAERQITNVAAGTEDTDAVNKAQLDAVDGRIDAYEVVGIVPGEIASSSSRSGSIAIGKGAEILQQAANSTVLGDGAQVKKGAEDAIAIGQGAHVDTNAAGSTAIGQGSHVSSGITNAVALGHNSVAYEAGTVSVGDSKRGLYRRVTNVDDGKGDYDAVNVKQMKKAVTDATVGAGMVQWDSTTDETTGEPTYHEGMLKGVSFDGEGSLTASELNVKNGEDTINVGKTLVGYENAGIVAGGVSEPGNGIALGSGSSANAGSIAIGDMAWVMGKDSIGLGNDISVGGNKAVAIGSNILSVADNSVALGYGSAASRANTVSVGSSGNERQITNVAAGTEDTDAVNVGQLNERFSSYEDGGVVAGTVKDGVNNSIAVGEGSYVGSNQRTALGEYAMISDTAEQSVALGTHALVYSANSVALGYNSVADRANTVSVGSAGNERQITNVAAGTERTDAVNVGQLQDALSNVGIDAEGGNVVQADKDGNVTIDGNLDVNGGLTVGDTVISGEDLAGVADISGIKTDVKTNASNITALQDKVGSGDINVKDANGSAVTNLTDAVNANYTQIQNNSNAINTLGHRVSDLGDEIDSVGAISAALAGLHPLDYDGTGSKFQISAAMGTYDGTQAAAIGGFYHFNRDVMMSLGGATSFEGDKKTAANIGVTFRVGEGASGKSVSDDVMARLEAMDQKIAALEQENKELKNVLGAIDTSLSKEFPDVPANHWAYEAVTKLAGNDVVAGYPDGEFHGDRTMTRYEMAEIIYKAMNRGAQVDQKLVEEFKPEMEQVAANTEGAETTPAAAAETAQPAEENA